MLFSPTAEFKGNRWLAIPACITARAWRTCRDACRDRLPAVTGKTFPAFPAHAHPQFCVSGKRPIDRHHLNCYTLWDMRYTTLSELLAICVENPLVTGEFRTKGTEKRNIDCCKPEQTVKRTIYLFTLIWRPCNVGFYNSKENGICFHLRTSLRQAILSCVES